MAIFKSLHSHAKSFYNPRTGNRIVLQPSKETPVENSDDVLFLRGREYILELDEDGNSTSPIQSTSFSLSGEKSARLAQKKKSEKSSSKPEEKKKQDVIFDQEEEIQYNVKVEGGSIEKQSSSDEKAEDKQDAPDDSKESEQPKESDVKNKVSEDVANAIDEALNKKD